MRSEMRGWYAKLQVLLANKEETKKEKTRRESQLITLQKKVVQLLAVEGGRDVFEVKMGLFSEVILS